MWWIIAIVLVFVFIIVPAIMVPLSTPLVSKMLYKHLFNRKSDEKKLRKITYNDRIQYDEWNEGFEWFERHKHEMEEVEIENDGLHLYGQYFPLGKDITVMVMPGRKECLCYSYYFAEVYEKANVNILLIDNRTCGYSDGLQCSLGINESRDLIKWMEFLQKRGQKVLLHGICVGCAVSMMALSDENCPSNAYGVITDGMYPTFYDMFGAHLTNLKRKVEPTTSQVLKMFERDVGMNPDEKAPIKTLSKVKVPMLIMQSEEDQFVKKGTAEMLYGLAGSIDKRYVYFPRGKHSRVRYNCKEEYDKTVLEFLDHLREGE